MSELCAFVAPARVARGRAIAPHLVAGVARGDEIAVADDATLAAAIDACARAAPPARDDDGLWRVDAPFASALPLSPAWRASSGAVLVAAPSRERLFYTTTARADDVRRLADRAERAYHVARAAVSPALYDAAFAPYHAEGALANATALGHALLAASEYEAQRGEMTHDREVAVAECQLVLRRGDERPTTVATWGERVATLLPIVDVVVVAGGDPRTGWRFAIGWDALERAVGASCWRRDDALAPPRVRTIAWPSPEALRALYDARDALLVATAAPPASAAPGTPG